MRHKIAFFLMFMMTLVFRGEVNAQTYIQLSQTDCTNPCGWIAEAMGPFCHPTYLWSNGQTTQIATGLCAGQTYTVTVTSQGGCICTTMTVTPMNLTVVANQKCDDVKLTVSGGSHLDYATYLWSNGATTRNINNVSPGTYTVTVTDGSGCTATTSINVAPFNFISGVNTTPTHCGLTDGSATASVNGGIMPYTYLWNIGATTQTISGIPAGTYTVTVTDKNGCTTVGNGTVATSDNSTTVQVDTASCVPVLLPWGQIANGSGTYTFYDSTGCGTNYEWTVEISAVVNKTVSDTICAGSVYNFGGIPYTQSGTFSFNDTTGQGCPCIWTLYLTVQFPVYDTLPASTTCHSSDAGWHTWPTPGGVCGSTTSQFWEFSIEPTVYVYDTTCDHSVAHLWYSSGFTPSGCLVDTLHVTTYRNLPTTVDTALVCDYSLIGVFPTNAQSQLGCDSMHIQINLPAPKAQTVNRNMTDCNPTHAGSNLIQVNSCLPDTLVTTIFEPLAPVFTSVSTCNPDSSGVWWTTSQVTAMGCPFTEISVALYRVPDHKTVTAMTCNPANAGTVTTTIPNSIGCDSVVVTTVTSYSAILQTNLEQTICAGEAFQFGTQLLTQQGLYSQTLTSVDGCDSLVTLSLFVKSMPTGMETFTICHGETLSRHGETYSVSGNYHITMQNAAVNGCDSLLTLCLTVLPARDTVRLSHPTCKLSEHGHVSMVNVPDMNGCDSITTETLYWVPLDSVRIVKTCDENFRDSVTVDTIQIGFCDGIRKTVYQISLPSSSTDTVWVCPGGFWEAPDGASVYSGQVWIENGQNQFGCDSSFTMKVLTFGYTANFNVPADVTLAAPNDTLFNVSLWIEMLTQGAEASFEIPLGATYVDDSLIKINDTLWQRNFYFSTPCEVRVLSQNITVTKPVKPVEPPQRECEIKIIQPNLGEWVYVTITPLNQNTFENTRYYIYNEKGGLVFWGYLGIGFQNDVLVASLQQGHMYYMAVISDFNSHKDYPIHDEVDGELIPVVKKIVRQ